MVLITSELQLVRKFNLNNSILEFLLPMSILIINLRAEEHMF